MAVFNTEYAKYHHRIIYICQRNKNIIITMNFSLYL